MIIEEAAGRPASTLLYALPNILSLIYFPAVILCSVSVCLFFPMPNLYWILRAMQSGILRK
jgi:hypothetical protein